MVICSCNFITEKDVEEAMASISDQDKIPSVNTIMKTMGKEAVCATCARSIKEEMRKHVNV